MLPAFSKDDLIDMAFVAVDGKRADLAIRCKANVHFNASLFTVELGVYGLIMPRLVLVSDYKFTKIFSKLC